MVEMRDTGAETGALVPFSPTPLHALFPRRGSSGVYIGQGGKRRRRPRMSRRARWEIAQLEPPRDAFGQLKAVTIGGLDTIVSTRRQLAQLMVSQCLAARADPHALPKLVFSSNGQGISLAGLNRDFADAIHQADIIHADGMPIVHASRWLTRTPLPERIATTDFFHDAARAALEPGLRFYLLGGEEAQNAAACDRARDLYPGLAIVGRRDGYFEPEEDAQICRDIVASGADVLWLGLGRPKQEMWAVANQDRLRGVGWIKTCGGLFSFLAGDARRAPDWMQQAGLEWLHRLVQEPSRLAQRYVTTNAHAALRILSRSRPGTSSGGV